jgi:hypothetical protein
LEAKIMTVDPTELAARRNKAVEIQAILDSGQTQRLYPIIGAYMRSHQNVYRDNGPINWFFAAQKIWEPSGMLGDSLLKRVAYEYIRIRHIEVNGIDISYAQIQSTSSTIQSSIGEYFVQTALSGQSFDPLTAIQRDLSSGVTLLNLRTFDWPGGLNAIAFGVNPFVGPTKLFNDVAEFGVWASASRRAISRAVLDYANSPAAVLSNGLSDFAAFSAIMGPAIDAVITGRLPDGTRPWTHNGAVGA